MKKRIKVKSAIVMAGVVAAILGMGGVGQAQATPFADSVTGFGDDQPRTRDVGHAYKLMDLKIEVLSPPADVNGSTRAAGEETKKPPVVFTTQMGGEENGGGKPGKPGIQTTMMGGEETGRPR